MDANRREWQAMNVPQHQSAQVERSCTQLIVALEDMERRCGPSTLELE